jgi:hypothetical protein
MEQISEISAFFSNAAIDPAVTVEAGDLILFDMVLRCRMDVGCLFGLPGIDLNDVDNDGNGVPQAQK